MCQIILLDHRQYIYRSYEDDVFGTGWPTCSLLVFTKGVALVSLSINTMSLIRFVYLFISSATVSHHVHGSAVYPGCANGRRAVQLQVYDTTSVHRRDPTEQ